MPGACYALLAATTSWNKQQTCKICDAAIPFLGFFENPIIHKHNYILEPLQHQIAYTLILGVDILGLLIFYIAFCACFASVETDNFNEPFAFNKKPKYL